jgi:hypothetical protein
LPPGKRTRARTGDSCAAQKFRLASKLTDTIGKPANQPFNTIYVHCCLRGAARNRWIGDSGRDEFGADRNQRVLPQLPSSQFSQPSTTAQEIERFFFALSTSRFGRDVWSCVPPCFKWTGITPVQRRRCSHLSNPRFTQRSFPNGIRDGGRREPREPRPCSLGRRYVCRDLAAAGTLRQVQESPVLRKNSA